MIIDEVAIRKHVEWDGYKYHGYVDFGAQLNDESLEMATECLFFLLVSITESLKLPVAYFLCDHLSSMQKGNLVEQCLEQIYSTGIKVVSLTFDGCPSNMTMVKNFGCDLRVSSLKTNFTLQNHLPIAIIPDPAHMIKLIRNTFAEKRILVDYEGKKIDFVFIEKLLILQETEHFHLANKLKNQHVFFSKMKMKVKLATQLLSKSVADALFFCQNNLSLKDFEDCDGTIRFIRIINDAFDILNSRNIKSTGKKKALCKFNFSEIEDFKNNIFSYFEGLKYPNGELLLNSQRKTGFLGFLICFNSLMDLKTQLIDNNYIKSLPMYRLSQDHLELFFGSVRSLGGCNNNPTARQFKSTFKKILIRSEVRESGLGNCIPVENIMILNCVSTSHKNPIDILNDTTFDGHVNIYLKLMIIV